VLEAFACGVPVVATDLGGLPELVEGGYGETTPAEDPGALAATLAGMLADHGRAFAMGQAARVRATEEFTPQRHLAGLERLYRRAGQCLVA
jgi:glycosyltransferase involved in cell wall biosynthesis